MRNLKVVEPTTKTINFDEQLLQVRKEVFGTYSYYKRESRKIRTLDKVMNFIFEHLSMFVIAFMFAIITADWLAGYERLTSEASAMMLCCAAISLIFAVTTQYIYKLYRRYIVRSLNKCCREEILDSIRNNFDLKFYNIEGGPEYEDQEDLINTVVEILRDNNHEYYNKDDAYDFDIEEMVN